MSEPGANHAMRYEKGVLQRLPSPSIQVGQAKADRFEALGINNGPPEVIVGRRYTTDGSDGPYAVMWKDGVYFDLHASLDASTSEAWDVNDAGVIVGRAGARAFRFDPGTPDQLKFVQLLTEGADPGYKQPAGCAKSINAQGHVAGWVERLVPDSPGYPTYEPFCFLHDGTLHKLPLMTYADASIDVNDDDVVVGQTLQHGAFRYDHTAKTIVFFNPHVPGPDPNWVTTSAPAINESGTVVGAKWGGAEGLAHVAVVWPPGKPMQTLMGWVFSPPDGLRLTDAVAINDKNEIVVIDGRSSPA